MNTQQAKRIPLADLLGRLGHQPVKEVRGELWYRSPFRREEEPSFKINVARNIWYDFGEGEGGNVLDFVMKHEQVSSIPAVLDALERIFGKLPLFGADVPGWKPEPASPPVRAVPEAVLKSLQHRALTMYVNGRGIPTDLAKTFVQEMHYVRDGKPYFALAFRNNSGGYELRNPYYKGTHGPKDITLLSAEGKPAERIAVFEGFMDFLSSQVAGELTRPLPAVIVMNSTAMKDKTLAALRESGATHIQLYLDHDRAGREITAFLHEQLPDRKVTDRSAVYAGHNDMNDYLVAQRVSRTPR